nr:uncharacterized protein LOC124813446 [Hydra vulgaris]
MDRREKSSANRKTRKNITKEHIEMLKHLVERNESTTSISTSLNLSKRTVQNLVVKLNKGEFDDMTAFKSFSDKKRGKRPIKDQIKNIIELCVQENNLCSQKAIKENLSAAGFKMSQPTISRKLKRLDLSRNCVVHVPEEIKKETT